MLEFYASIFGISPLQAADQLRNTNGLQGALGRPATYAHYEDADLALQVAVLVQGIAEGQPFIDGNKRIALVAMLTFLEINDLGVRASDPELADWIVSLSEGTTPEQRLSGSSWNFEAAIL